VGSSPTSPTNIKGSDENLIPFSFLENDFNGISNSAPSNKKRRMSPPASLDHWNFVKFLETKIVGNQKNSYLKNICDLPVVMYNAAGKR
jgi:hypothetical protein